MPLRTAFLIPFLLLTIAAPVLAAPPQAATATTEPAPDAADLLPNGRQPAPDLLVGGQPTAEQLALARSLGYTTVINLRSAEEMQDGSAGRAVAEELGMSYVEIPVASADDIQLDRAAALFAALDQATGPTIVHCKSGNRVGALFALQAFYVDGVGLEEALEAGREAGLTRLEPVVRERLTAE
jgi:uncharacterized protein (TIGR01244 family)